MDKDLIEKKISGVIVFKGTLLEVHKDEVLLPNGAKSHREYIKHNGAVAILVFDKDDIYMERQFRYPINEVIYEIPAGKIDLGEEELVAAHRELKEETGLTTDKLIKIGSMYNSVGYSNEVINFYYTNTFKEGETHLDENEFIDVIKMPFSKVLDMVLSGEIKDSKTAYGIMIYDELKKAKKL